MDRSFPRRIAAALLATCFAGPVFAGLFSVSPVRIYMSPRDRAVAVTITNESDEELVMQADVYEWKQKAGGEDDLTLSEDLVLSPPILKLAPRARQVVRLATLKPVQGARQATYRLIVREIPEARKEAKNVELQVALAFSMPVFITPPAAKKDFACTASRSAPEAVQVSCENTGETYIQPREFGLVVDGRKVAARENALYYLPGTRRTTELRAADGARIPGGAAKLEIVLDDGTTRAYELALVP